MPALVSTREWNQLIKFLEYVDTNMTALQTALQELKAEVATLSGAATASPAKQFTDQDVQDVVALTAQVKMATASVSPAPVAS